MFRAYVGVLKSYLANEPQMHVQKAISKCVALDQVELCDEATLLAVL